MNLSGLMIAGSERGRGAATPIKVCAKPGTAADSKMKEINIACIIILQKEKLVK
jgi:NAD-dependent oxidoreductase involved in siderophore biosynthesis